MKKYFYLMMLFMGAFGPVLESCDAATNVHVSLKEKAEAYVKAYMRRDYQTCLKMMGGQLVNALGGNITVLDNFRRTEEFFQQRNLKLENIIVGEPGATIPYEGGKTIFSVISEKHSYISQDSNKYILNSYILAVSEDNGQSWNIMEGSWKISEHIKNHDLILYDLLKLPTRKIYLASDPHIVMVERGGGFVTPPETTKYRQSLRQHDRDN